jgi:tetratricopeptide (TPR) repeat protein
MTVWHCGRHAEAAEQFRLCQRLLPSDPAPFLNMATVLLDLGDPVAALDAAKRARRRAMNLPQAQYTVGLVLMAAGRLEDAIQAFADTLRFDPKFADASVNLGVIRYRRDDIEGARHAMRRALQIQPGHRGAAANLATFMRLAGEVEAGEALLSETLSVDPDAGEARVNLAASLLTEERSSEALAVLVERPVASEFRLAIHWRLQRSQALLQLGRAQEARAELDALGEPPVVLSPLLLWRRALLAVAEGDIAAAQDHATEMEQAVAASTGLLPEHRIMAQYDLARFWSAQGERDRAFAHWIEGHRLLARFQPFSRDAHRRFVDATLARFDHARLHHGPRAANRDPAPVFIVGMPRSGTTLAEQIIGAHPRAFAAGERLALSNAFRALGGGNTDAAVARVAALDAAALDKAAAAYLDEMHALAPDAARIVDKMPGNFLSLGLVALMLPGARIIQCVRDPRDIGLSDLHLPVFRPPPVLARPWRPRLVHRRASPADGALARGAAEPHADRAPAGLGARLWRDTAARTGLPRTAVRPGVRALLRAGHPGAHRQPRAGAPADQRARPRPLAWLCTASSATDRGAGRRWRSAGRRSRTQLRGLTMTTEFTVASEADLNAAIRAIDLSGSDAATNTAYTIKITTTISLTTDLLALNLPSGSSAIVEGTNGSGAPLVQTIDGNNNQRGFFIYSGAVTLADLSIQNAVAQGGGGAGGRWR